MKVRKHTLLIADDDPDQRFFLKRSFDSLGTPYTVQLTDSGAEAIDYLKGHGKFADRTEFEFPSYIVTDLHMGPGDGFHVLEFLRENPALSVIPIVLLSTSDHPDDVRHAYLLGASSYIVKPHGLEKIQALVKKIHDYWMECEVPEVDGDGYAVPTNSDGRPGARYTKPQRPTAHHSHSR